MRVLLRDLETGRLHRADGVWAESPFEATDYKTPEAAREVAAATGKHNLEVLVVDDRGRPKWGRRIEGTLES
jgi:hypothetical protein